MFVSKFISFRAVDGELAGVCDAYSWVMGVQICLMYCNVSCSDYGERVSSQSWTVPAAKVVKPIPVSSPDKPAPKPSDQVTKATGH